MLMLLLDALAIVWTASGLLLTVIILNAPLCDEPSQTEGD